MRYLADLHVHSPFSLATSQASTLANLAAWGAVKGLSLIGTGDFTHPGWLKELRKQLRPAEAGFFRLAESPPSPPLPGLTIAAAPPRFLLTSEISCVYQKEGRSRKVHCLVFAPDLAGVERFTQRLAPFGNLASDGRPTLRLDARDLLEILLESIPAGILIPAHIWTPWFSLLGARSGFDRVEQCFGDLSDRIFALETGLSSDPAMNRRLSALDRYTLISNSDCHAPSKLGREANIFETGFDYPSLAAALRRSNPGLAGTIEFFPEEGKYFADGHRRCHFHRDQAISSVAALPCPICDRPLTQGVAGRIANLADRGAPPASEQFPEAHHVVPLGELLAELAGRRENSKTVQAQYIATLNELGPELPLLLDKPLPEIALFSPPLARAIGLVRSGRVIREKGYDGQPGRILVLATTAPPPP
ncbi:MAG TPA: endonuclease Q family protein [Desulfurivibrionaceae bacterium]|nr:endonuclease Q family protein [Desulfurivibrionaceae bacterium]